MLEKNKLKRNHVDICSCDGSELYKKKNNYPCVDNVACSSHLHVTFYRMK